MPGQPGRGRSRTGGAPVARGTATLPGAERRRRAGRRRGGGPRRPAAGRGASPQPPLPTDARRAAGRARRGPGTARRGRRGHRRRRRRPGAGGGGAAGAAGRRERVDGATEMFQAPDVTAAIFVDRSGRRARTLRRVVSALVLLALLLIVALWVSQGAEVFGLGCPPDGALARPGSGSAAPATSPPPPPQRGRQRRRAWRRWVFAAVITFILLNVLAVGAYANSRFTPDHQRAGSVRAAVPVPAAVRDGGTVVDLRGGRLDARRMPARTIALTFDDGPDPMWTPKVLDVLSRHHAPATFFVHRLPGQPAPGHRPADGPRGPRAGHPHLHPPRADRPAVVAAPAGVLADPGGHRLHGRGHAPRWPGCRTPAR